MTASPDDLRKVAHAALESENPAGCVEGLALTLFAAADELARLRCALDEIAAFVESPGRPVLAVMAREALSGN